MPAPAVTNLQNCTVRCNWRAEFEHKFNSFSVGKLFRCPYPLLVVGHEDGVVRTYELPVGGCTGALSQLKCQSSLETKGGSIQKLVIHNVTKFHANDLIVADSRGTVTVLCNGQILTRKAISQHALQCLQVDEDKLGNVSLVAGDSAGVVTAFSPHSDMWKIRLSDVTRVKGVTSGIQLGDLLSVVLSDPRGQLTNYVLATDNSNMLYFLQQGTVVLALNTPARITAMCAGQFLQPDHIENNQVTGSSSSSIHCTQVALGSDTGAIYIMSGYEVYQDEFANIQTPITCLHTLRATDTQGLDSILCAGWFNGVSVVKQGQEVGRYKTPAWVNAMVTTSDLATGGDREVVIGCKDRSVHGLQVTMS